MPLADRDAEAWMIEVVAGYPDPQAAVAGTAALREGALEVALARDSQVGWEPLWHGWAPLTLVGLVRRSEKRDAGSVPV